MLTMLRTFQMPLVDEVAGQNVTHLARLHFKAVQICIKNGFYAYVIKPKSHELAQ